MTRLRHTERALIRTFQMSRIDIFVFIEGWADRYFYDKLCQFVCQGVAAACQVRTSEEIGGRASGKTAMLDFFGYLRRKKLLFHQFKGKKVAVVFFLDKDVDDFLRVQKRSNHVIYTEYYCLENYLFRHVDLAKVTAAAVGLDAGSVKATMGDQDAWLHNVASQWKDWVRLCLTTRLLGANCQCNYGRPSQVNQDTFGNPVAARVAQVTSDILVASGLPIPRFDTALRKAGRIVDNTYARRQHDRVFKGKWYGGFLAEVARQAATGRPYNANGLDRIPAIANASTDVSEPWAEGLRKPFLKIVALF